MLVYGEVSSLVVNMTDSVMTAPPGNSGIRLKREIWTWAGMRTRIAQVVERRTRNPEVQGLNPSSDSNFSHEILLYKFPKAQVMSLFSINNLFV